MNRINPKKKFKKEMVTSKTKNPTGNLGNIKSAKPRGSVGLLVAAMTLNNLQLVSGVQLHKLNEPTLETL